MKSSTTKRNLAELFANMSKDAQETAVGMILLCIEKGHGMGMDEGKLKSGKKRAFRKHLEKFSNYKK